MASIEHMLSEAGQRRKWKERLAQLDEVRAERIAAVRTAVNRLCQLVPGEGQVLLAKARARFANAQVALRAVLSANGLGDAIERAAAHVAGSTNRHVQIAGMLLGANSKQDIIKLLAQISTFEPRRDPHDPSLVCQSEIHRHFRGLLVHHLLKLEFLPDHSESVELQSKLFGEVVSEPTSPSLSSPTVHQGEEPLAASTAEHLTERDYLFLETMLANEITSKRRKKRQAEVVKLVNRNYKPATYKRTFAKLARLRLVSSLPGPTGGEWLTAKGIAEAKGDSATP